jgi:predicted transposase YbfD/YdcC
LRVFQRLDPKAFEWVFREWVCQALPPLQQVAIDGKTLCGSAGREKSPLHMVSAFATEVGLVLGREVVAEKSNEITAIPALLEALALRGCLVSIDAMGCQKDIAKQIKARGANYLLAVKKNQPALQQNLAQAFAEQADETYEQAEKSHGRMVVQRAQILCNRQQVDTQDWAGCQTLGKITSLRISRQGKESLETRYYISSAKLTAEELHAAARRHWEVENRLHWVLDVDFREDHCRVRKDNGPRNLSVIRKFAMNVLRQDTATKYPKASLRARLKMADWDDDERMCLIGLAAQYSI